MARVNIKKCIVRVLQIIVLCPLFAGAAPFSYVDDSWIEVKSANFILVTDHDEKTAREMIGELERFRYYVQLFVPSEIPKESPPLKMFGFKKRLNFNNFVESDKIAGFYSSSADGGYAIAELSTYKESDADKRGFGNEALLHEYVHYLSRLGNSYTAKPRWLSEGMAEYLSTMITTKDEIKYGRMSEHSYLSYHYSKYGKRYVPVEKMLKDDEWNDDVRDSFYPSSVIYIHYSLADPERKKQFNKFVGLLSEGASVDKAWAASYDIDYAEMGKRLKKYLNKRTFNYSLIKLKKPYDYGAVKVTKLTKADTQVRLATFLLNSALPGYMDKIEALGITDEFSYKTYEAKVLLAEILIRKSAFDKAEKLINEQMEHNPEHKSDWLQLLGTMYLQKSQAIDLPVAERIKYLAQARGKYRASIHANNLNFTAYLKLGDVYSFWRMIDESLDMKEGIVAYDEALYFMDWDHAQENLADMLYMSGEKDKANILYKKLMVTSHRESYVSFAKKILNGSKAALFLKDANGCVYYGMHDLAESYFKKAIAEKTASSTEFNDYAWWLITGRSTPHRNKLLALQYAQKAVNMSEAKVASTMDTLAAAYAANGEFELAVATQKKAISLADKAAVENFKNALSAYEKSEQFYGKN